MTIQRPKAILFDMDGTLTCPLLDFPAIKREMGIGDRPILEAMAEMNPTARRQAEEILLRCEAQAAQASTLNVGCIELLEQLAKLDMPTALITRNSRQSVTLVLARHGVKMDVIVSREDAPYKPDPAGLWLACERLGVRPSEAWMVGDGQYDVEAGLAAGAPTVWISHHRQRGFAAQPWLELADLPALRRLLDSTIPHPGAAGGV